MTLALPIVALIDEVVNEFANGTRMFTAYEVSKEVQTRSKDAGLPVVRHLHMKEVIHAQLMNQLTVNNGSYQRQLKDVGAPTPAWVYYPDGGDPSGYTPMDRDDTDAADPVAADPVAADPVAADPAAVVDPVTLASVPVAAASADPVDPNTRTQDATGRLHVPNFVMRAAGFSPDDTVYVYEGTGDKPSMVLSKDKKDNSLTDYKVDGDGRVRISNAMLTLCKLDAQQFDFDGDTDVVEIKCV